MVDALTILVAAVASWGFGAIWYGLMGDRWMRAVGISRAKLARAGMAPFFLSFALALVAAAGMAHILSASGTSGLIPGALYGALIGLFLCVPWIANNYLFAERDPNLIWIDGTYATVGSALMGAVLGIL